MVDHDHFEGGGFAGYIRVSPGNTYADVQRSVAAQKQMLEKFTEEDGSGTIVWYVDIDDGIAPPALQALLADAKAPNPGFDTVLVYKFSRMSRNLVNNIQIRAKLRESGVTVVSVSEPDAPTPTDRLIESVIQTMDEFQRELHAEDTRRGIEGARRRREGC